ncbi:T9SS type A sorting domain-containing protein [Zobellia roscoffensis]|uniref:T9SS type A sorting domain-containing protein n=1 Tax=Zobellia roscoffensis TaxID=2779508 RepID=UPI00188AF37F|nr:T9SS type A sorting domain-containing protein [Zobellia roscoffensis]
MLQRLFCLLLFLPLSVLLQGQCMIVPEPLENLITASPLVVEGKVRSQESFWDSDNKNIYTVNEIEVFKVFQGVFTASTIHVVTKGGVVGLQMDRVSSALELEVGDMGLFMLQDNLVNLPVSTDLYRPTEGVLGYIHYDLPIGTAQGVYDSYSDISGDLYGQITNSTGLAILDVGLWDQEDSELSGVSSVEKSIVATQEENSHANFEIHAGVGNLLTITGADFGNEQGSVLFPDANSGGNTYIAALPSQVKQWSNDKIELEVPYRAGTGAVRIDKANGESLISEESLLIGYDHINIEYTTNVTTNAYETQLTSDNGVGGYNFQYITDFSKNSGATQAFDKLIETWSCATGVNFKIGEVTTVDEDAADGINVVRFDNGDELSGNTLAYARSRYQGCFQEGTIKWFVSEIEVVVNDDYNWYYGDGLPSNQQFDFETVMLHEIGHAHQLGHVINSGEVMHFSVGPGQQKRELSEIDSFGGEFVTNKSTTELVCGRDLMDYNWVCCETLVVTGQPSGQVVCVEGETAKFSFDVDFAHNWKWQENIEGIWVDLMNNDSYSGVATNQLTVVASDKEQSQFRCIAGNFCEEFVISDPAELYQHNMDVSVGITAATCSADGTIQLNRNNTVGTLNVVIAGIEPTNELWLPNEDSFTVSVPYGDYSVVVERMDAACAQELGTFKIQEPMPLTLTPELLVTTETCTDDNRSIKVYLNDHPRFSTVLLSIDGGKTFESFKDTLGSVVFENLTIGTYDVLGKWEDESCETSVITVQIEPIKVPELAVEVVHANCEGADGTFLFELESDFDFNQIEVSVDGGVNYDYLFDAESDEIKISELSVGTYQLWARWEGLSCGGSLGVFDIKKQMENGEDCSSIETDTIEDSDEVNLSFYPNPAKEQVYVKSRNVEILKFQLFSALGVMVLDGIPERKNEDTFYVEIGHLQAGIYTLQLSTVNDISTKKVIIE